MGSLFQSEVIVLRGLTNIYLVRNTNCALLVDTGSRKNAPRVAKFLHANNIRFGDLDLIIVTHSHHDHVGSLAEVKRQTGAKVLVHEKEADILRTGTPSFPRGTGVVSKTVTWFSDVFFQKSCSYQPVEPEVVLAEDIDLTEYGMNVSIICTPGHTAGSISVVVDNDKAIVGDAVFNIFSIIVCPPWADEIEKLYSSWKKLLDTGCRVFYPAHGLPIPVDMLKRQYEKRVR